MPASHCIPLFKVFMDRESIELVARTLDSGYLGQGPMVERFEREFEALLNLKQPVLATSSGTAALDLAYDLVGAHPGSSVVTTPFTCLATNIPLLHRGVRIIWADVDPLTGLIDPDDVASKVCEDTVAVVAVDWAGAPADYTALRKNRPPVIQDGAHSLMADTVGGDYRMWSFQAIKHLTTGDGGALLVPPENYECANLLRWYGLDRRLSSTFRCEQDVSDAGYKYGMNDIAASIGIGNIGRMWWMIGKHQKHARWLCGCVEQCSTLGCQPYNAASSYWIFPMIVKHGLRDEFIGHMASRNIFAGRVHARNDTKSCFSTPRSVSRSLCGVAAFDGSQVNIPCGWWLTPGDIDRIADAIQEFDREHRAG